MIKIITLVENTAISSDYGCKHGLSLYIETEKHKILFDLGPDGLFAENAEKLNIDISTVDTVVISHGHNDHAGALKKFMALNSRAKIYIRKEAFEPHYIKVFGIPVYIGLDTSLISSNQLVFTNEITVIDEELVLFSNVKSNNFNSESAGKLFAKKNGRLVRDDFVHEQNLIIKSGGKKAIVTGCSHSGIVNILDKAETVCPVITNAVIGGFHLYNPPTKKYESNSLIDSTADMLKEKSGTFYTCHCTGIKAYERMKKTLDDRLKYLSTGSEVLL